MKTELLIKWINNFEYPHCIETQTLNDLKSGIAICQIVYEIILNKSTPKFLSKIIISNINSQYAINNFSFALENVLKCQQVPQQIKNIRPQELYYNDQTLLTFIDFLYNQSLLRKNQAPNFKTSRSSDIINLPKKPPLPRSSMKSRQTESNRKDILAEASSQKQIQESSERKTFNPSSRETYRFDVVKQQPQQEKPKPFDESSQFPVKINNMVDKVQLSTKIILCQWLDDIQLIKMFDGIEDKLHIICKNGMIFIDLLNWLNGKQVVITPTTKYYNQFQTIQATYKKILSYLSRFQRMNPRYLFSSQQLAQGNQDIFWGLLDDIYHLHHNKISRYDRRYSRISPNKQSRRISELSRIKKQKKQQQEKQPKFHKDSVQRYHHHRNKTVTTQGSQKQFADKENRREFQNKKYPTISSEQLQQVQQWLRSLGFSYSLQKAINLQTSTDIYKDPIRNGTIVGSIIMRLQIGKINIIKEPTCQKHIKHNFQQINTNCLRRSLNISSINPPYTTEAIYTFLFKLKSLNLQTKQKNSQKHSYMMSKQKQVPQYIKKWIQQMEINDVRAQFTRIANSIVKVDICRETTKKIQENNINKILWYLKKIGLIKYLSTTYDDIMNQNNHVVWELIQDLYALKYSKYN